MNTTFEQASGERPASVDLVDFKWLMAGVGWWVNVQRLQRDRAYADECLQRAMTSGSQLLRERGPRLLGFGHDDVHASNATVALAA